MAQKYDLTDIGNALSRVMDNPMTKIIRSGSIGVLGVVNPVAGIVGGIGNDLLSEYNTFKLGHLLNGLASGFNLERRLNELYNYVNSSPEKAIIVANLFKQTVNAECPKVCVIYGLILANHLETLTEFTHEELIVCKALENATDYDLKNFKEIMENYLKPTSNGRRIVFPKDFADIAAFTTTCDWCVYNRIFVSFSWNMTGYIPKHQVNPHGDGIIPYVAERIFQLEPEPPAVDSLNEYILSALREKNLLYFSFFLHHYETQLNKRIKGFLSVDGGNLYDTDRFIDIKISCREQMLQKLMDYDPAKGAEYATYIYPFIWDSMLRFRMGEEKWSVSSLTNYKMVRSMAWLYHNTKDAVNQFSKKYNCDLALAEEYLKVVRGIRNQQPFYITDEDGEETGEDIALDDSWNYTDILWNGIQAEKVQRAFEKLNYREQTLLEKRLAICMTCGRVGSWKNRPTFEELAIMFEGSTASGAERAYRKAVDKLTELLVAEGALHAVRLKQKTKTKRKKKIAAAIYEYQADCDGEWGEISVDFENGTAEIIRLADWDTIKTNWFAKEAIRYILSLSPDALTKYMLVPLEPPLIS